MMGRARHLSACMPNAKSRPAPVSSNWGAYHLPGQTVRHIDAVAKPHKIQNEENMMFRGWNDTRFSLLTVWTYRTGGADMSVLRTNLFSVAWFYCYLRHLRRRFAERSAAAVMISARAGRVDHSSGDCPHQ